MNVYWYNKHLNSKNMEIAGNMIMYKYENILYTLQASKKFVSPVR